MPVRASWYRLLQISPCDEHWPLDILETSPATDTSSCPGEASFSAGGSETLEGLARLLVLLLAFAAGVSSRLLFLSLVTGDLAGGELSNEVVAFAFSRSCSLSRRAFFSSSALSKAFFQYPAP